ncbi:hypothetical protein BD414DRAFT_479176 [Trametes punicea]|nr:hypothetical protein BD414DRAFT_479176 [Trametes punicea]
MLVPTEQFPIELFAWLCFLVDAVPAGPPRMNPLAKECPVRAFRVTACSTGYQMLDTTIDLISVATALEAACRRMHGPQQEAHPSTSHWQ